MKTLELTQKKEKLSGQDFTNAKTGKIKWPLENHVSINFLYVTKNGSLKPTYVFISPNEVSVDSGWSTLDSSGNNNVIELKEMDVLITPFGKFELCDKKGNYPVDIKLIATK